MIFRSDESHHYVLINGVKITVPRGVKYVTINMYEVVQGWFERPYISEGSWDSDDGKSVRIGEVDFSSNDTGHYNVYEVQYR